MTREEFIEILEEIGCSYEIEGDNRMIISGNSRGIVNLASLKTIPPGIEFNNKGGVYSDSLTSLPLDVKFNNGDYVQLDSVTSIPPGVEFRNGGYVQLYSLITVDIYEWKGNLGGIDSKRLLNMMIKRGVFI